MSVGVFDLELIGPFRLRSPDGARINIASKKAQAMMAMLAVSASGERTRSWLQCQLWSTRAAEQAQASLRNELSSLRTALNSGEQELICSDKNRVWLNLDLIRVDSRDSDANTFGHDSFLQGLDIAGEDGFEEWLREERGRIAKRNSIVQVSGEPTAPAAPIGSTEFAQLPAIAVLPFANVTGDPAFDYRAEGLSEDLIDLLSRLRWLPVISRGSSFAYRDGDYDPRVLGGALGARYLLEGRLRRQGRNLMLAASLANCDNGQILWSDKLPLDADFSAGVLENLLTSLAALLGARIDHEEQMRSVQKPGSDLNVRELIWRGRWHINRMTKEDSILARACFDKALAIEPNSSEAIIQNVWARVWELWAKRGSEAQIREMRQMAQKAIIADCDDARGHMLAGIAEIWLHEPLRAEALLKHAIDLNPSLAMAHAQLGSSLRLRDIHHEAIAAFRAAIRLSPNDHDMFFFAGELAASLLMIADYNEALILADQAIARRRGYWFPHVTKINALVRLDRMADAKRAYADLISIKHDFTPDIIEWSPFADPKNIIFLKDGLNLAAS